MTGSLGIKLLYLVSLNLLNKSVTLWQLSFGGIDNVHYTTV